MAGDSDGSGSGVGGDPVDKPSTVNDQIVDAVNELTALAASRGPAASVSMLNLVATETVALGMYNAVARQQADATIGSAATAALCARMMGTSLPAGAAVSQPALGAAAEAQAQAGIRILTGLAAQTGGDSAEARAALRRLAAAASAGPGGST